MTEGHPAVHTAGSLIPALVIAQTKLHLAVVIDPFLNRPVSGVLAAIF
jgi:hypothetical protein